MFRSQSPNKHGHSKVSDDHYDNDVTSMHTIDSKIYFCNSSTHSEIDSGYEHSTRSERIANSAINWIDKKVVNSSIVRTLRKCLSMTQNNHKLV